jgi:hypothetical protein
MSRKSKFPLLKTTVPYFLSPINVFVLVLLQVCIHTIPVHTVIIGSCDTVPYEADVEGTWN